jgi:hypothetical protein
MTLQPSPKQMKMTVADASKCEVSVRSIFVIRGESIQYVFSEEVPHASSQKQLLI